MKIIHRVSFNSTPETQRLLAQLGVSVEAFGFVSVDIDESLEAWPELRQWIARRKAVDIVSTKFTQREVLDARWLALEPHWHHGYPQPNEDDFGYLQATYDLSDWCSKCGSGKVQRSCFQMKKEPRWGRRGILQLHWVSDEFFVKPDVWLAVFKPHGVGCRPVVNVKGVELETVVQLVAGGEVSVAADQWGSPKKEICSECGRSRYTCALKGRFPRLSGEPRSNLVKTKDYFGTGSSSFKGVVVSRAVAQEFLSAKVRGAWFRPVMEEA